MLIDPLPAEFTKYLLPFGVSENMAKLFPKVAEDTEPDLKAGLASVVPPRLYMHKWLDDRASYSRNVSVGNVAAFMLMG